MTEKERKELEVNYPKMYQSMLDDLAVRQL
jgi:hypothetical protein